MIAFPDFLLSTTIACTIPVVLCGLAGVAIGLTRMAAIALAIPATVIPGPRLAEALMPQISAYISISSDMRQLITIAVSLFLGVLVLLVAATFRQMLRLGVLGVMDRVGGAAAGVLIAATGFPAISWALTQGSTIVSRLAPRIPTIHF